jgi:hypothetical protein
VRVAAEVVHDGHHDVVIDGHGEEDGANEEDGEGASRDAEARADATVHGCGLRHHPEHDGRGPDREHLHHRLPTPIAAGPPPPRAHHRRSSSPCAHRHARLGRRSWTNGPRVCRCFLVISRMALLIPVWCCFE